MPLYMKMSQNINKTVRQISLYFDSYKSSTASIIYINIYIYMYVYNSRSNL